MNHFCDCLYQRNAHMAFYPEMSQLCIHDCSKIFSYCLLQIVADQFKQGFRLFLNPFPDRVLWEIISVVGNERLCRMLEGTGSTLN
jgi:hypothetical protein